MDAELSGQTKHGVSASGAGLLAWVLRFALVMLLGAGAWLWLELRALRAEVARLQARVDALSLVEAEQGGGPVASPRPLSAFAPGAAETDGVPEPDRGAAERPPRRVAERLAALAPGDTPYARRTPGGGSEVIGDQGAVREALVALLSSDDPELQAHLREAVDEQVDARREQHREARQLRWEQRTVEQLQGLGRQVGLSEAQQDGLFAILSRNRDRTGEAFRAARADHSFGEARDKAVQFRAEADAEARQLLDDDQFAAYQQMREEERARRGFRRSHRQDTGSAPAK